MRRLLALVLVISALGSSVALAGGRNGLATTAPKKGSTIVAGSRPVFKGKVAGDGVIFVYVSKSPKTNAKGVIRPGVNGMSQQARRTGGTFSVKAKFFDYPEFWLNVPGTYYWQAHRIACENGNTKDCLQEGPVVAFTVG